jgi:DNA-3-methyladenine glycosylase
MVKQLTDAFDFMYGPASEVAPRLLGSILERTIDGQVLRTRIVETEAYDQTDAASHSYKGKTPRTEIMFGPPGFLYVYFTYGMHYCCNVVTGPSGDGAAVLLRAAQPLSGIETMSSKRHGYQGVVLTNGPAKLCQALAIDKQLNGHNLRVPPLRLVIQDKIPTSRIVQTVRVGIKHATDVPWRFYVRDNTYVSRL